MRSGAPELPLPRRQLLDGRVSATAGCAAERAGSFRTFLAVHMTICEPFQTIPIGTDRGVPSSATKAGSGAPHHDVQETRQGGPTPMDAG